MYSKASHWLTIGIHNHTDCFTSRKKQTVLTSQEVG